MAVLRRDVSAQGGVQSVFHDLATTSLVVQVRGQDGTVVPAESIRVTSPNSVEIDFPERLAGQSFEVYLAY